MADKKISQLTGAATPLAGTEVLPIVQSGSTVKVAVSDLTAGRTVTASNVSAITTSDTTVLIQAGTSNYSQIQFGRTGTGSNLYRGYWAYSHATDTFEVGTAAVERFKLNATGITLNNGNLVIGTAGKGIDFSANPSAPGMTSELLTYYETGTWTPTDTSGAGLTLTVNSAVYTRIGNVVTVQAKVTYPVTASALGAAVFGFPYAASSECAGAYYSGVAAGPTYYAITGAMYFANSAGGAVSNATLSGSAVIFNMTYKV